jgi:hypothetical protein
MPEDRIAKLSQRFKTHGVGRKPASNRNRERHSFYLDSELVSRLDKSYRDLNHKLYPKNVSKSAFLETLVEYGLDHLVELQETLSEASEQGEVTE